MCRPGGVLCSSFLCGSYPTVWFASPSWFALVMHGAFCPNLTKHCSPSLPRLPAQPPLASGGCSRLCCFSAWGVTAGLVICWFKLFTCFSFLLCCPLCFQGSPQTGQPVFSGVWKPLFLRFPSQGGAPSLPPLSPFSSLIFFPICF